MSWTNEITLNSWNGKEFVIGIDNDGDIGIFDDSGYSIIIAESEAQKIIDWLQNNFIDTSPQK